MVFGHHPSLSCINHHHLHAAYVAVVAALSFTVAVVLVFVVLRSLAAVGDTSP